MDFGRIFGPRTLPFWPPSSRQMPGMVLNVLSASGTGKKTTQVLVLPDRRLRILNRLGRWWYGRSHD